MLNEISHNTTDQSQISTLPLSASYASGSLRFMESLAANSRNRDSKSRVNLNIIIVGAGLGGLSTACALARRGHHVTVFEQTSKLGEVGAGIQMPPNSTRLLLSWGLGEFLQNKVVEPTSIVVRRWESGAAIGLTKLDPEHKKCFGAPYYVIHRAHFHEALHKLAIKLGVHICLGSTVQEYNASQASIVLGDGSSHGADLVIAADGIKSTARKIVVGSQISPVQTGFAAYRATVNVDDIRQDHEISWIVEQPKINLWLGDGRHAMTYPIASGKSFNLVLSHPAGEQRKARDLGSILEEMKSNFAGWDHQLVKLISLIHTTMKWPLMKLPSIPTYLHESHKLVILGDGAHAMLPYMSQGAAMAVEDGAALAQALHLAATPENVPEVLQLWNQVRVERASQMQDASTINGVLWHFSDGPEQQARDNAMQWELSGDEPWPSNSPNQWSDQRTSAWCFGYDAEAEISQRYNLQKFCVKL